MFKAILLGLFFIIPTSYAEPATSEICPCPYSLDASGMQCGENSAYSKSGGIAPICYENDLHRPMGCPVLSRYTIPPGFRLAGISPSCQAVIIPLS